MPILSYKKLNYFNAIKNLNLTLGTELEKKWIFIDSIDTEIKLFSYDDLKTSTLANNTNVKNQYYNIQLSKEDIKLAKSLILSYYINKLRSKL